MNKRNMVMIIFLVLLALGLLLEVYFLELLYLEMKYIMELGIGQDSYGLHMEQ